MNSLQRIILIDSYMPGVFELKVDAHTNICGINASGKTTLQRLLLVFYGELPSNVVPKTRDSFEKWYLPRSSSYIVYEYVNHNGELKQVVLSSSLDNKSVNYRFIDKAYCQSDYIKSSVDNLHEFYNSQDLARQLKAAKIDCSGQLTVMEYRAVIQNDANLARSLSSHKEIKASIRQYSLCGAGHSIRHIEKLVRAIHTKNGKMAAIKSMVAAILEEEFVQSPSLKIKADNVKNWANETLAIEELSGRRQDIIKLSEMDRQIAGIEQQLGDDAGLFERAIVKCAQAIEDDSKYIGELKDNKDRLETDWSNRLSDLNMDISAAKSSYQTGQNELSRIASRYNEYLASDIEQVLRNLPFLPAWQKDILDQREHYSMLTHEHSDIMGVYQTRLNAINENETSQAEKERGALSQLQDDLSKKTDVRQQENHSAESKHHKELDELTNHYQQKTNQLSTEIAGLKGQMSSMSSTEEEALEIEAIDQCLNESDLEKNDLIKDENKADKALRQAVYNQSELSIAYQDARRQVAKYEDSLEMATKLCFPEVGTLLQFLRTEMPEWTDNIGKIISPDLLQRKDLKPSAAAESNTMFGLALDLKAIDATAYARNEAQLQEDVRSIKESLRLEKLVAYECSSTLAKANDAVDQANKAVVLANSQISTIDKKIEDIKHEKSILRERHKSGLIKRKETIAADIKKLEASLVTITNEMNEAITQIKETFSAYFMELKVLHDDAINELNEQIKLSRERLTAIAQNAQKSKKDAKQFYEDTLADRGINEKTIAECKSKIDDLETRINETQHRRQEANEFKDWKVTALETRKPQLLNQVASDQELERSLKIELSEADSAHKKYLQGINCQLKGLFDAIGQLRNNLNNAERIVGNIKSMGINASKDESVLVDLNALDGRRVIVDSRVIDMDQKRKKLKEEVDKIDAMINKSGASKLSEVWEKARADSDKGIGDIDNHVLVGELEIIFNTLLPQLSKTLLDEGRNYGTVIKSYFDVLADVNHKISAQSSRITRNIEADLELDGVSESSVNIISKISKLDYWGDLNNFMAHFEKWRETGYAQQPGIEYIKSIKDVSSILSRNTTDKISIADLLDIEIRLKEGNSHLVIKTDQEMTDSSSQGMAYLILCKFLLAFTRMLRGHADQIIHWPIDELGTLHVTYIEKVFKACDRNNIIIVGAFPNSDLNILKLFTNRYMMNPKTKVLSAMRPQQSLLAKRISELTSSQNNLETVDE